MRILDIQACFQVAHGSYRRREAMLWQKIEDSNNYAALVHLLTTEIRARAPGARQLHGRGPEIPRSVAEPSAADVGLVTPVLVARFRIRAASRDHLVHDVGGRANVANASHRLADEHGGGIEILCRDGLFEGAPPLRAATPTARPRCRARCRERRCPAPARRTRRANPAAAQCHRPGCERCRRRWPRWLVRALAATPTPPATPKTWCPPARRRHRAPAPRPARGHRRHHRPPPPASPASVRRRGRRRRAPA